MQDKFTGKESAQYGKKGRKPRVPYERKRMNIDTVTTNDITDWNEGSTYTAAKLAWPLINTAPTDLSEALPMIPRNSGRDLNSLNPPVVMAINTILGPGYAENTGDGVNIALARLISLIRSVLSTSNLGFETADLGIYLGSTSSIAALIAYAKRTLESVGVWKDRNKAYPRGLIRAMGFSYDEIVANRLTYVGMVNALIDRYNDLHIPDVTRVYDRQYAMMKNIFCDEDSEHAQLYIFKPANYYTYSDTSNPSKAVYNDIGTLLSAKIPFKEYLDIIDQCLESWRSSSDLYTINGKLLQAFKEAPVQEIPHLGVEDTIEPVQDRAFLMQIMNCTIHGVCTTADITQQPEHQNYVIWRPVFETPTWLDVHDTAYFGTGPNDNVNRGPNAVLLRVYENDVTDDDNIEMTRLTNIPTIRAIGQQQGEGVYSVDSHGFGSEIVQSVVLYEYDVVKDKTTSYTLTSNIVRGEDWDEAVKFFKMCAFRYLPTIIPLFTDTNSSKQYGDLFLGDVYNWTVMSQDDWKNLQYHAYISLWKPRNV